MNNLQLWTETRWDDYENRADDQEFNFTEGCMYLQQFRKQDGFMSSFSQFQFSCRSPKIIVHMIWFPLPLLPALPTRNGLILVSVHSCRYLSLECCHFILRFKLNFMGLDSMPSIHPSKLMNKKYVCFLKSKYPLFLNEYYHDIYITILFGFVIFIF